MWTQEMNDLINLLKGVAPTLATVVAGPLGGKAVSMIADKFGVADSVEAVAQAIAGDPQAAQKLTELELEFAKLDSADRNSSRDREIRIATSQDAPMINKIVTPVLALGTVAISFILLGMIMFLPDITGNRKEIAIYVLGAVNAATVQVLSYYFGASHDHKKDVTPSILEQK
jgi:hypothetical protein